MRTGPAIAAVAVLLALAGCTPSGGPASSSPTPSATPVFASDAEALAAAEKAYAAYLAVSDQIAQDGGKDPERIAQFATGKVLSDDLAGFSDFESKGWKSIGSTTANGFQLQESSTSNPSNQVDAVVVYLCEDVSKVDVIDSGGSSVVSSNRKPRQAFEVGFNLKDGLLLPSSREPWSGTGICA